jgi:cell division septation protein DedD
VDEMRGRLADLGGSTTPVVAQNAPGRVELVASQAIVAARRASERGATPAPAAVVPTTTGAATASSAGSPASASTTTVATAVAPADSPTVAPVTTVVAAVGPIRAPAAAPRDWTPVVTREPALVRESALPDLPARERTSDGRALLSTKWAAPRSGTPYWVQVGAFQSLDRLVDTASALRDQSVTLVTEPDHPLTRVMVGPFTDRATAASKVRELRARGYQAFIAEASK